MVLILVVLIFLIRVGIKITLVGIGVASYIHKRYKKAHPDDSIIKEVISGDTKEASKLALKKSVKLTGKIAVKTTEVILKLLDTVLGVFNKFLLSIGSYVMLIEVFLMLVFVGISGWYLTYIDKKEDVIVANNNNILNNTGDGSGDEGTGEEGTGGSGGEGGTGDSGDYGDPGASSGGYTPDVITIDDAGIQADIANGLYSAEDYAYLVALGGESSSYEGFYAVACSVRNRVNSGGGSYKSVVTAAGQYAGYHSSEVGNPRNSDVKNAAVAVLRGGSSSVGSCTFFFGRVSGYDLWAEPGVEFHNVGNNIYYKSWGDCHNKKASITSGAIIIYSNSQGKWLCPSPYHHVP